jgi:hypothetical protein
MTVELEASVVVGISSFDLDEAEDLVAGVQVRAAPHTLNPAPNALHPTPYTLHPTPSTLNPRPYNRQPKP